MGSVSLSLDPKIVRWRFAAAVVAVPLFDALIGYLGYPWLGVHGSGRVVSPEQPAFAFLVITGVLGLAVMIVAALPLSIWLIQRGHTSIEHFTLAGTVLGNLPFAVYLTFVLKATLLHAIQGTLTAHLSPIPDLLMGGLRVVLMGSVIGAASGALFWLIAAPRSDSRHWSRVGAT